MKIRNLSKKAVLLLTFFSILMFLSSISFAYYYMGSGKWASPTFNYVGQNLPSMYMTPALNAAAMWRNNTDFKIYCDTNNYQVTFYTYNYGNNGKDGYSAIGQSWDSTYKNGNVQLNSYYTDSYSDTHNKLVIAHEFGHIIGMDHTLTNNNLMYLYQPAGGGIYTYWTDYLNGTYSGTAPGSDDVNGVNNKY